MRIHENESILKYFLPKEESSKKRTSKGGLDIVTESLRDSESPSPFASVKDQCW